MKSNPEQLAFDLPDNIHPGVLARREQRERIKANGEDAERAALAARHRQEWDDHLDLWNDALLKRNPLLAELAKELAQTLKIRQAEERLAWAKPQEPPLTDEDQALQQIVSVFEQHPELAKRFRKLLHANRRTGASAG
ncbi:MAG: hypothetical protein ABTR07_14785 [Candidatus Competibacter denitrificans]